MKFEEAFEKWWKEQTSFHNEESKPILRKVWQIAWMESNSELIINSELNDLNEIEKRTNEAKRGPWKYCQLEGFGAQNFIITEDQKEWMKVIAMCFGGPIATYEFIAHARTDIPNLVAEVKRLKTEKLIWNDVKEKLPEENGIYLVQTRSNLGHLEVNYEVDTYFNGRWDNRETVYFWATFKLAPEPEKAMLKDKILLRPAGIIR